jgi:hypothetical protein
MIGMIAMIVEPLQLIKEVYLMLRGTIIYGGYGQAIEETAGPANITNTTCPMSTPTHIS